MARFGITKPLGNTKPEHVFDAAQVAFKILAGKFIRCARLRSWSKHG